MKPRHLLLASFILLASTATAQWSTFCTGITTGYIMDLTQHDGYLYASGSITSIGGTAVHKAAKWDGAQWLDMGTMADDIHALRSIDKELYATVYSTSENDSNWLYQWDGSDWQKMGAGFYLTTAEAAKYHFASIYDVVSYNNELYVCGEFDYAGSNPATGIAKWNGTEWEALNGGLSGTVNTATTNIYPHKMLVYKNELYVVGNFKEADGVTVNGVARWDGAQWHALGSGFNKEAYGIESYKDTLYVCGTFTASGANTLGCVAKWDGTQWVSPNITASSTLGGGYQAFGHTLKTINSKLYLAGGFNKCVDANNININASNVMEYDGTRWYNMGGGTDGDVEGLAPYNGRIMVAGGYTKAGGTLPVNSMALWLAPISVATLNKADINIYPNPVKDKLVLDGLERNTVINIYSVTGQHMWNATVAEPSAIVDVSKWAACTYIIQLSKDGVNTATSFVKQ